MAPGAAVAELEAVIAAFDDVKQPARRRRVRIVVDDEQPAEDVATRAEWIPEPGRDATEFLAVGRAVKDVAAFAAAGESRAVGTGELVRLAEVLADAEVEVAARVEREPAETVVRVITLRVEERDPRLFVGLAVAVGVAQRRISFRVAT